MKPIKKENKGSQLFSSMIEGQKRDFNKHLLSKTLQSVNSSEQKMNTVVRDIKGKIVAAVRSWLKKHLKWKFRFIKFLNTYLCWTNLTFQSNNTFYLYCVVFVFVALKFADDLNIQDTFLHAKNETLRKTKRQFLYLSLFF